MKLELLTNATVVDDAIRFVTSKTKENLTSSSDKADKEESNGSDFDDQLDQKEESTEVTNQVF